MADDAAAVACEEARWEASDAATAACPATLARCLHDMLVRLASLSEPPPRQRVQAQWSYISLYVFDSCSLPHMLHALAARQLHCSGQGLAQA